MRRSDRGDSPLQVRRFRTDIEGLRGLALVLVLVGHAGVTAFPAAFVGVDAFFVISGFLITGLLVDEARHTGRIRIVDFYLRRIRRLVPAASVVIVASLLLTYLFLPPIRWSATAWDALASAGYAMNWRLVEQATDYLRAEEAPSALQHFWSLAVEEQFYLLWPLLLLVAAMTGSRRAPARYSLRFLLALVLVGIPSLAWSISLSQSEPARAYFVTTTRMWELALGGGLAILAEHLPRLPRLAAIGLGWAGMATIALAAMLIRPETAAYPGYLALLPTLGTAAIIAAGPAAGRHGPALLLERRPMRTAGAISYSWYLWHWPLLVVAQAQWGPLGPVAGLATVLCAAVPAVLTYHLVENPFRYAQVPRARTVRMGLAATAVTVLAGLGLQLAVRPPATPAPGQANAVDTRPADPSSGVGAPGQPVDRYAHITPDPLVARDDLPDVYRDGCITQDQDSSLRSCTYGNPDSPVEVALVGDSHAAHWVPALQVIAAERGWRLVTYIKTACSFLTTPITIAGRVDHSCTEWNRRLRRALTGDRRPRLLIASSVTQIPLVGGTTPPPGPATSDAQTAALVETWSTVVRAGLPLVVLRDTPAFRVDMAECVSANRERLTACAQPRERALAVGLPQERAAAALPDVRLADLNTMICPSDPCPAVINGVLVYRDSHHLTATFARNLARPLDDLLRQLASPHLY